jgi:osmotically-inducible protein OsmY
MVAAGCDGPKSSVNSGGANKPANPAMTADATSPGKPAASELSAPPGSGKASDDGAVTTKGRSAIGADPGMRGTDISVATQGGVVQLKGTAKSAEQVSLAAALAQRQEGVRRVDNSVEVK